MRNFRYMRAATPDDAVRILGGENGGTARVIAGGTDLVPLAKDEIVAPDLLVDISGWRAGAGIEKDDGSLVIGAITPLSAIAESGTVRNEYAALADACGLAATPQLRNMGTIGGNLLQQTRCWYYRGPFDCWLKGGEKCYARGGENEYHSIFATEVSPCVSAHPSDPAAALLALDARVRFVTPEGEREMAVEDLYALPEASCRSFNRLPEGAVVTALLLPAGHRGARSTYVKAMPRASWAFALAGVGIALNVEEDGRVSHARIALSGVAPIPMRVRTVEAAIEGQDVSSVNHKELAALLVKEAQPLAHNGYKVALLRGVFSEALEAVCWSS